MSKKLFVQAAGWVTALTMVFSVFAPVHANHGGPYGTEIRKKIILCHDESGDGTDYHSSGGVAVSAALSGHTEDTLGQPHYYDIIPPFHHKDGSFPGQNWNSTTEAIWDGGNCGEGTTPDPETAFLTLVKVLTGDDTQDVETDWTLTAESEDTSISGATGSSNVTNAELPVGEYLLSEDGPETNYTASDWVCVDDAQEEVVVDDSTVTLAADEEVTCTITNTYDAPDMGTLTLIKDAVGGEASDTDWTLTATGPQVLSGVSGVTDEVLVGNYDLTEANGPAGYDPSAWSCVLDTDSVDVPATMADADTVTVSKDQNVVCTIVNTAEQTPPDTGTLTLIKEVEGGNAEATDWTLTATGPQTITGATGDAAITNAEVEVGNYDLDESGDVPNYIEGSWECVISVGEGSIDATMVDANTVTVSDDQDIICTVTNTYSRVPLYSLSGKVYHDNSPENGEYDAETEEDPDGEDGLNGWTVNLYKVTEGESLVGTTESSGDGDYSFNNLTAGCYIVREVVKDGWDQTDPTEPEDAGVVVDYEYEVSLGGALCGSVEVSFLDKVIGLFVNTAQAVAFPSSVDNLNFGNIEEDNGGGSSGGSRSGSRDNDDDDDTPPGRVLGETDTPVPTVAGAELPRTGLPILAGLVVALAATAKFAYDARKKNQD